VKAFTQIVIIILTKTMLLKRTKLQKIKNPI